MDASLGVEAGASVGAERGAAVWLDSVVGVMICGSRVGPIVGVAAACCEEPSFSAEPRVGFGRLMGAQCFSCEDSVTLFSPKPFTREAMAGWDTL